MADSTEDLRREMEEFERSESSEEATGAAVPAQPAKRQIPKWVYWMLVADLIIVVAVVMVFAA